MTFPTAAETPAQVYPRPGRVNGVHPTVSALGAAFVAEPVDKHVRLVPLGGGGGHQPAAPAQAARPVGAHAHQPTPTTDGADDADLAQAARRFGWIRRGFYATVLGTALAGQVSGAVEAMHIPLVAAVPAVAALELGGVVVLANADMRRRLGERAHLSRLLSALIAAWAVAFNWLAHAEHLLGGFFAGMSALGYAVWVMHTENQRRDRLRAKGKLAAAPPPYELWGHWICHPFVTLRAKSLAKADSKLGLYDSIGLARTMIRQEKRDAAISKVLDARVRDGAADPQLAIIAAHSYDLDAVAAHIVEAANYPALAAIISRDLDPERLAQGAHRRRGRTPRVIEGEAVDTPTGPPTGTPTPTTPTKAARGGRPRGRNTPTRRGGRAHQPGTPTPTEGGMSDAMRTRLAQLDAEFPNVLPGRDKVMAHMKTRGIEGWSSKTTVDKALAAARAKRVTPNGDEK